MKRLTKEEFIKRAKEVHGDRYDYSKVDYINNYTKVIIVCPEHGEFKQRPHDHLLGQGCPKCSIKSIKLTTEEFIKRAKEIHGNKYDYSKVNYVNYTTPVTIVCPEHGEFKQRPSNHLIGHNCPRCMDTTLNTEEFIKRAKEVHGDKYDYSKVNYINAYTKIIIVCPIHGKFEQKPYEHLKGCGCPVCRSYRLEKEVEELLTDNNIEFEFQKTFDWLKSIKGLSLDFYLPGYDIAIECQGRQHFQAVDYFGGEDRLKYTIGNDKLKLDLCKEHGIKIIYYSDLGIDYPYEVVEDLNQILNIIKTYEKEA